MNRRQQALLGYFYTIVTDPRVQKAEFSATALKDAVLSCAAEDLGAVAAFVLRGGVTKIEEPVAKATRDVASTVLGGVVSERAGGEIASGLETMVRDGFRRLGDVIDRRLKK